MVCAKGAWCTVHHRMYSVQVSHRDVATSCTTCKPGVKQMTDAVGPDRVLLCSVLSLLSAFAGSPPRKLLTQSCSAGGRGLGVTPPLLQYKRYIPPLQYKQYLHPPCSHQACMAPPHLQLYSSQPLGARQHPLAAAVWCQPAAPAPTAALLVRLSH
jgi:hypothetical protein